MIVHMLHSLFLHNRSFVLLSPKVHALSVPWKKSPEVIAPPPTSALMHTLIALVRDGQRREDGCGTYSYVR